MTLRLQDSVRSSVSISCGMKVCLVFALLGHTYPWRPHQDKSTSVHTFMVTSQGDHGSERGDSPYLISSVCHRAQSAAWVSCQDTAEAFPPDWTWESHSEVWLALLNWFQTDIQCQPVPDSQDWESLCAPQALTWGEGCDKDHVLWHQQKIQERDCFYLLGTLQPHLRS